MKEILDKTEIDDEWKKAYTGEEEQYIGNKILRLFMRVW